MVKKATAQKRTKPMPGANAAEKAHTVVSSEALPKPFPGEPWKTPCE
jgi:hypothetical protein